MEKILFAFSCLNNARSPIDLRPSIGFSSGIYVSLTLIPRMNSRSASHAAVRTNNLHTNENDASNRLQESGYIVCSL